MTFASKIQGFNSLLVKLNGLTDMNEVSNIVNRLKINMDRLDFIGDNVEEAMDNIDDNEIKDLVASADCRRSTN